MPAPQPKKPSSGDVARYADMFSAMGTEPRLRIMQLLLSAHPDGLVVNEIGSELDIPSSRNVVSEVSAVLWTGKGIACLM